jgi:hypothetical protein
MLALSGRILIFMSGLPFEQGEHHAAAGDCPWTGHASGWLTRRLARGPACRAEALPVRLRSCRPTIGRHRDHDLWSAINWFSLVGDCRHRGLLSPFKPWLTVYRFQPSTVSTPGHDKINP